MKTLLHLLSWDLIMAVRYQIVTISAVITILYLLVFKFALVGLGYEWLLLLIFTDPCMFGFLFIGVMVLFEKSANTLQALVVTPIKSWQYLWSKAIALSLIIVPCSLVIALAGHGFHLNYFYFLSGVILSSLFFVFLGFIGVAKYQTFNEYLIIVPLAITPAAIPLLSLMGIFQPWFYLIPTQGSLILLEESIAPQYAPWQIIYAFVILILAIVVAQYLAKRAFEKRIIAV